MFFIAFLGSLPPAAPQYVTVFIPCGEIVAALQTSANQMPENIRRVQVWETANIDPIKKIHTTYLIDKQQEPLLPPRGP